MVHGFQKQFQMQDICNFFVTNYLFVISKEIIARKQIFQVFNMCYYVQRIFVCYIQPIRSVSYPKGINELISQYKCFAFSLKYFLVLAQVVVNKYWKGVVMWSQIHSRQAFLHNLIITRLGPLLDNQWQCSIFEESTSLSTFLKIF